MILHRARRSIRPTLARRCLVFALVVGPVAALAAAPRRARAKVPQRSVQYRPQPNGAERCAACVHYRRTEGACELVEGDISPDGWCALYDPQGAGETR